MKRALDLCLVHVIWTERQMSKLVLNVRYLLLLPFLTAAEFYNLGHIQGTVKLGNKERFDKEQIGIKEPFPVTNLPFTS